MQIKCTCGKVLKVPDHLAGKNVKCPACNKVFKVPAPPTDAPAAATATPQNITVECACGKKLSVPPTAAGKRIRCPSCQAIVNVPAPSAPPASPAEEEIGFQVDLPPKPAEPPPDQEGDYGVAGAVCPTCHSPLETGAQFCVNCGMHLGSGTKTEGVDLEADKREKDSMRGPWGALNALSKNAERDREGSELKPEEEESVRTKNLIRLGVALLLGFILPIIIMAGGEVHFEFLNITGLKEDMLPGLIKFMLIYPLIAGTATILLAIWMKQRLRGAVLMVLAVLPLIVLMTDENAQMSLRMLLQFMDTSAGIALVVGGLAFLGLFAGSRSRWYMPNSKIAAWIGIGGGVCYILNLFIPVEGQLRLVAVFKMLGDKNTTLMGIFSILSMGCMVACAVLCFMNTPTQDPSVAASKSKLAFIAFVSALGVAVVGGILQATMGMWEMMTPGVFIGIVSAVVKMAAWIGGLLFLFPIGLTDLLVGPVPRLRQRSAS